MLLKTQQSLISIKMLQISHLTKIRRTQRSKGPMRNLLQKRRPQTSHYILIKECINIKKSRLTKI